MYVSGEMNDALARQKSGDFEVAMQGRRDAREIRRTKGVEIAITGQTNKDGTPYTFWLPPTPPTPGQVDSCTAARFGGSPR